MTKDELLDTLMLLSALESWSFSSKTTMPDYLWEKLEKQAEILRR